MTEASLSAPSATPQRMTRQRAAVEKALAASDDFRSAQEWHDLLRHIAAEASESPIGLATVYRTLQSLAESGDVDTVRSDDGEALYRRCGDMSAHHHHLRCRGCGAAVEIEGPGVEEWASAIAARHGYSRIQHTVELTGLCDICATKEG
jgi:Fur family transcriptional regulator, ferric uptake regulator